MGLALIALVGTGMFMATELRYYVQRRRPISATAAASSAVSRLFALSHAVKSWGKEYADF
jgi:hypothetical protein